MKLKIFNLTLAAFIATITLSAGMYGPAKAAVQTPDSSAEQRWDDKAFQKQMQGLQKQMSKLQAQMSKLKLEKNKQKLAFNAQKFNKEFKEKFKDFGKNFAGSFSGMVPAITDSFKGMDGFTGNVTINGDSAEYHRLVASGEVTEKIKNYSKTYSVDANDVLQIVNSFGKITVNTWARNEFKVDVQMKFGSDDADAVEDMINGSSISDSKNGNIVSFRTNIYKNGNSRGSNHQNMQIDYVVYMPAGNAIDISNRFESVTLPELSGKVQVKVSYGALNATALTGSQNNIDVRFGDAVINNFNSGSVNVAYGKFKAGVVNNLNAEIKFSAISIERLKGSADVNVRYGDGFRIGTIERGVKSINVDAQFTKINFDISQIDNFNFDITTRFGDFHYGDDRVKVTQKSPSDDERGWSSTKSYKGYIGKDNSANRIVINASYTGVNFN